MGKNSEPLTGTAIGSNGIMSNETDAAAIAAAAEKAAREGTGLTGTSVGSNGILPENDLEKAVDAHTAK